jgi:hypothetical protein
MRTRSRSLAVRDPKGRLPLLRTPSLPSTFDASPESLSPSRLPTAHPLPSLRNVGKSGLADAREQIAPHVIPVVAFRRPPGESFRPDGRHNQKLAQVAPARSPRTGQRQSDWADNTIGVVKPAFRRLDRPIRHCSPMEGKPLHGRNRWGARRRLFGCGPKRSGDSVPIRPDPPGRGPPAQINYRAT